MRPRIVRRSDAEVRAIKQKQVDTVRAGGFRRMADREQAKLDKKYGKR